jgi:hypothetical protein
MSAKLKIGTGVVAALTGLIGCAPRPSDKVTEQLEAAQERIMQASGAIRSVELIGEYDGSAPANTGHSRRPDGKPVDWKAITPIIRGQEEKICRETSEITDVKVRIPTEDDKGVVIWVTSCDQVRGQNGTHSRY